MPTSDADDVVQILLVEDSAVDAKLVAHTLEGAPRLDVVIDHCESLAGAQAHLTQGMPDVLLLDLSLPDASGLEVVHRLRGAAPRIPMVVLTGDTRPETGEASISAGAQDYVPKSELGGPSLARAVRYAMLRARCEQLERERARVAARREHIASVGRLSSAVAHDLSNSLTILQAATDLLQEPRISEADRADFRASVFVGVERASSIAERLFALGGGRPNSEQSCDLHTLVALLVPPLGEVLGSRAVLRVGTLRPVSVEHDRVVVEAAVRHLTFRLVDELAPLLDGARDEVLALPPPLIVIRTNPEAPQLVLEIPGPSGGFGSLEAVVTDEAVLEAMSEVGGCLGIGARSELTTLTLSFSEDQA